MKRFSENDCELFLAICRTIAEGKVYSLPFESPESRRSKFWELRAALRRDDMFQTPPGYGPRLAECVDIMDHIQTTVDGYKLTAFYKE